MKHRKYIGLTEEQVVESRRIHGTNVITPPPRPSLWKLFLEKFEDPIIKILLSAAAFSLIISFVHGNYIETIGIVVAILMATVISFAFEVDAGKKFNILNRVNNDIPYKVVRNGSIREIPQKDIVVGDILLLDTGEEVPADGELLEAVSLQVNESSLTGEPISRKTTNPEHFQKDTTLPSNWLYRGTTVVDGHGVIEVKHVGDATLFGSVAQKSSETVLEPTPLNQQLDQLAKFISIISFSIAIITFIILFVKDITLNQNTLSLAQIGSVGILLVSAAIMFIKIWFPVFFNIYELKGIKKTMPRIVSEGSWMRWFLYGLATFFTLTILGFFIGINPLEPDSWISATIADHLLEYFLVAVTLIVVSVPEGLPMSVTLSLAINMRRMLKTNTLVRKLHATETMGAVTVICTDKTGTLTQNQMQVFESHFFALRNEQTDVKPAHHLIYEGMAVNTTAHLDLSDPKNVKPIGNPTESALLLWLNQQGINYEDYRTQTDTVEQLTFSTERKFMATLIQNPQTNKKTLYIKGAPEIILSRCKTILTEKGIHPIDEYKTEIQSMLNGYQKQALRTLAFAYEEVNDTMPRFENGKLSNSNPIFLGLVAISDPLRSDVADAIKECLSAGIDVKIVTGDTFGTAKEIGRQLGLIDNETNHQIITGTDFEAMLDQEVSNILGELKILCRARPNDKLRLVKLLQQKGEVVAVTGDGTNDAPALNHAHVGLSMGSGTSVAKEASDITIIDDSFTSIVNAILWGRSLYLNIQRFIVFQLTINFIALIVVLVGSIFGHNIPLTITQMLWVNLIMDTFAAAALASLPPDQSLMKYPPRKNSDFIITPAIQRNIIVTGIFIASVLLTLFLYVFPDQGQISQYDLTRFFTIFVMLQFWNLFNVRIFGSQKALFENLKQSPGFLTIVVLIFIGQILIVQFGGKMFRTVPLNFIDWAIIVSSTASILLLGHLVNTTKKSNKK